MSMESLWKAVNVYGKSMESCQCPWKVYEKLLMSMESLWKAVMSMESLWTDVNVYEKLLMSMESLQKAVDGEKQNLVKDFTITKQ